MLHLVVATHSPENCKAAHPEVRKKAPCVTCEEMDKYAKARGMTVQGRWTNMLAHTIYFLVDAHNAHVVSQMFVDLHFVDWNTVVVNPVLELDPVIDKLQPHKPRQSGVRPRQK